MTKKEKKEILIQLITVAIAKEDIENIHKLFAELCYMYNYNYNYVRLIGSLMSDKEYEIYLKTFLEK